MDEANHRRVTLLFGGEKWHVPEIVVEEFLIDDDNAEKFWRHGLSVEHVLQVLESRWRAKRNRKERRASQIIIGRDRSGQCIAIPIEPTFESGVWRPVTAWFCKPSERSWLP